MTSDDITQVVRAMPGIPGASSGARMDTEDAPYRMGEITDVAGLAEFPPTVTLYEGDNATRAFITGNVWDWHPGDVALYVNWNGTPTVIAKQAIVGTDWTDTASDPWHLFNTAGEPAYLNNYVNYFDTHGASDLGLGGYRMQGDGWVMLKGVLDVSPSGTGLAQAIVTLPVGWRPPVHFYFIAVAGTPQNAALLRVDPDGVVRHIIGGTPNDYLSLDGIIFPTRWNSAGWIHIGAENDWNTDETDVASDARIFLRGDGWCWLTGQLQGGPTATTPRHIMFSVPPNYSAGFDCQMLNGMTTGPARLDLGGSSSTGNRRPDKVVFANHTSALTEVQLGGLNWYSQRGANNDWNQLTLINGWLPEGSDFIAPEYRVDPHGMVHLRGLADGALKSSDIFANIPAGFRPLERRLYPTIYETATAGRVEARPDGDLVFTGAATGFASLTGVRWLAEA